MKALISFAVTAKLICAFVFAFANCLFYQDAARINDYLSNFFSLTRDFPPSVHKSADQTAQVGRLLFSILMFHRKTESSFHLISS